MGQSAGRRNLAPSTKGVEPPGGEHQDANASDYHPPRRSRVRSGPHRSVLGRTAPHLSPRSAPGPASHSAVGGSEGTPMSHQLPLGRTGSDVDQAYVWGRPVSTYLAPRQIVRLMILRSRLADRHLLRHRAPATDP